MLVQKFLEGLRSAVMALRVRKYSRNISYCYCYDFLRWSKRTSFWTKSKWVCINSCRRYIGKISEDRTARLGCLSESARKLWTHRLLGPALFLWVHLGLCFIQIPARVAVAGLVPHLAQLQIIAFLSLLENEFEEMWPRVSSLLFWASQGKMLPFLIPYTRMMFFIQWA